MQVLPVIISRVRAKTCRHPGTTGRNGHKKIHRLILNNNQASYLESLPAWESDEIIFPGHRVES